MIYEDETGKWNNHAEDVIAVEPYDPRWADQFANEQQAIRECVDALIPMVVEHFGSTAIPGLPAKPIIDILVGTSAGSWMLKDRGPRMLQADPEVTSAVDIFVKDLGIVLEAGRETKAALPMTALAYQLFNSTSGRGEGTADDSQVIRAYRALNGTTT